MIRTMIKISINSIQPNEPNMCFPRYFWWTTYQSWEVPPIRGRGYISFKNMSRDFSWNLLVLCGVAWADLSSPHEAAPKNQKFQECGLRKYLVEGEWGLFAGRCEYPAITRMKNGSTRWGWAARRGRCSRFPAHSRPLQDPSPLESILL